MRWILSNRRWSIRGVAKLGARRSRLGTLALSVALLAGMSGGVATGASMGASDRKSTGCDHSATTAVPQPTQAELHAAGLDRLPLAPDSARRDLVAPPFSHPTSVTNPLFPISDLHSAILNGHVDGKPFYTETTLLPYTRLIEWTPGQCVRVLVSQYMAYLGGRLQETAIDLYAQDDAGSVWYLGETVHDYAPNGLIVTTEGTWQAGVDGPFAMIMPANPQPGDVNRAENLPGTSFEEVHVQKINQTFSGPSGPVSGGMVALEIHSDAPPSDKLFAPGYGEFLSRDGKDIEAMALANPTDSLPGGVPPQLSTISNGADQIYNSPLSTASQWKDAEATANKMLAAWKAFRSGDVPPRLVGPTDVAMHELLKPIAARNKTATQLASVDASYASIDLQLRYRPVTEVDTNRFDLWARRAAVHAASGSLGGLRSDLVTLQFIRYRIQQTLDPVTRVRIDSLLGQLDAEVVDADLAAATKTTTELRTVTSGLI